MKKVFSFDIFDTLITRCYSEPVDLFRTLGHELARKHLITISPEDWAQIRVSSEVEVRKSSRHEEITLSEIYQHVCYKLQVPEDRGMEMAQLEIERELSSLRCITPHVNRINMLRNEGHKVIFISDMYLPFDVIKQALLRNNIACCDEELFISSAYRETKHTGKLFLSVLKQLQIKPSQLIHTGDNIVSDYQVPKSLGISATHFSSFGLPGREQLIRCNPKLPLNFRSVIAGSVRLNRLNSTHDDRHNNHIQSISSTVIAPILFGFTLWTLLEARKRGLSSLHFISRDGQILKQIGERINKTLNLGIDCRYFYGSRQAFHLPATMENDWEHLDWLYDDTSFFTVKLVFGRVELTPDPLEDYLSENGFPRATWEKNLNKQERERLRDVIQASSEARELVLRRAGDAREKLLSYLKQEGIHSNAKIAFVDIGWNGRLQRSLSKVMDSAGIKPSGGLIGFYFGLRQRLKASADDKLFAWYYDEENDKRRYNNVVILEKFVEATHGSVVGYKRDKDHIVPVFKEQNNHEALQWGLEAQQAAILEFSDLLCSNLKSIGLEELNDTNNWIEMTEILLSDFCKRPTALDAQVFGKVSISEDQNHARSYPLAKPLTLLNCVSLLLRKKPNVYNDLWISGSLHLTPFGNLVSGCLKIQDSCIAYIKSRLNQ